MEFATEREALVRTGKILLKKGLVARTWGNLSIKVDGERFLITPSGRNYETVKPEDLALVSMNDLTWTGPLKPSSEKELHARAYRNRPDAGAIIHTHQPAASALAAARKGFALPPEERLFSDSAAADGEETGGEGTGDSGLGPAVPCVPYALPTTSKLAKAVEKTLGGTGEEVKALLLSNHGAVCLGVDIDEALKTVVALEEAAEEEILAGFRALLGSSGGNPGEIVSSVLEAYADGGGKSSAAVSGIAPGTDAKALVSFLRKYFPGETIHLAATPYLLAAARRGKTVRPLLDDFAQLIGPTLPVVVGDGGSIGRIVSILKRRSAVLIPGLGCLCMAADESDSRAVAMVAEKNCRAAVVTKTLGGGRRISPVEARLMRILYLAKYSKKAA